LNQVRKKHNLTKSLSGTYITFVFLRKKTHRLIRY
jgi:hypothetical protein